MTPGLPIPCPSIREDRARPPHRRLRVKLRGFPPPAPPALERADRPFRFPGLDSAPGSAMWRGGLPNRVRDGGGIAASRSRKMRIASEVTPFSAAFAFLPRRSEHIGRASCRERVLQNE